MSKSKPRWWPAAVVGLLWVLALARTWSSEATIRQQKVLSSIGASAIALVLTALWLLLLSRLPWRTRLAGVGLAALVLAVCATTLRIRGVTGDLVPVLELRWAKERALPLPAGAARETTGSDGASFPQFQGPRRDAVLVGPPLGRDWNARPPRRLWRRDVGASWAGFAIAGGRAFTQEQRGEHETVTAYDLVTGEPLWAHAEPARYETTIGGVGPRSTPTFEAGRLYALGGTGRLRAFDAATGGLLWQRDLLADHAAELPEWGTPCAPLAVDGKIVVNVHGPAPLAAYDAGSGALLWTGGSGAASYSSPRLVELAGRRQIVSFNQDSVSGHDPADGRELWRHPWPAQQPNVSLPVPLEGDRLFASSGYGVGGKLLAVTAGPDGALAARLLWETPRLKAKFANVVAHRGALYGLDDGVLVALDPATGERHWRAGRYGHGQVLLVGELLLVQAEDGRIVLVEARPDEHRELASFAALDGKSWNPPALAGRLLLVRNDREAIAYELPLAP